ncbi:MAG TPA: hypothetical protein VJ955_07760 [Desulfuromonadales bacterium]|nr:hypothetical protein [Desulfuromonadales bacterium]
MSGRGGRFWKGLILLLVLLWPTLSRAAAVGGETHPAAASEHATKNERSKAHADTSDRQGAPHPRLSREDREVIKMMDLLEKMQMLQNMDLITATEEKQ